MVPEIRLIKGIHPGIILDRELKRMKIAKSVFALSLNEYPQVLGEITKGKRKMNIPLALKIEKSLGLEEGYFMQLQLFHDIRQEKRKQHKDFHPDFSKLRPVVFWDTKMHEIDWIEQKQAVIERINERGNVQEKEEIERFYSMEKLKDIL